jgi:Rod binding domain-containing protein
VKTISLQTAGVAASTDASGPSNETSIRDAAQQFESFLIKQMLRELRSSSLAEPQSNSSMSYREMADEIMADHMAKSGAFGFGRAMADQMLNQVRQAKLNAAL